MALGKMRQQHAYSTQRHNDDEWQNDEKRGKGKTNGIILRTILIAKKHNAERTNAGGPLFQLLTRLKIAFCV